MAISKNELQDLLQQKARTDAAFLSYAFARYMECRGENEEQLAGSLSCSIAILRRLELCRRPISNDPGFRKHIETIAHFGGIDPNKLVQLLRTVETIDTLRGTDLQSSEPAPLRLAARESGKRTETKDVKPKDGKES